MRSYVLFINKVVVEDRKVYGLTSPNDIKKGAFEGKARSNCEKSIKPCDKYNNSKYSNNQSRNLCLKDSFCGWCTNGQGVGKCVSGTAAGPINIYKYNFCKADNKNSVNNSYEYGKHLLDTEMM